MSAVKLEQAEGDGSFFLAPEEDDLIGVEHLLAEPICTHLGDGILGFDVFSPQQCFNIEQFSPGDYGYTKIDNDMLDANLTMEKEGKEFLDGLCGGTNEEILDESNIIQHTCEDYLLDIDYADEVSDLSSITSKESHMEKLHLESQSTGSGAKDICSDVSESSPTSVPVLEAASDLNPSLIDKTAIDELHGTFRDLSGREVEVRDQQRLKCHKNFGLQNLTEIDNGSNLLKFHGASDESEGKMIISTGEDCFRSVFNFKTKPRVQRVKRQRHATSDSFRSLSSEFSKVVFDFPDWGEKKSALVRKKRLHKPTQRYIVETLGTNSRYGRRKCGISSTLLDDKIDKQNHQKGFGAAPRICQEGSSEGDCIKVLSGLPVQEGWLKKEGKTFDRKNSGLLGSYMDSDRDSNPGELKGDLSNNHCIIRTKTQKGMMIRKKHNIYWSLSEVLKLVEGVSKYGVGRWAEIKTQLFPSSANRTSVNLKDKWRNLLRASCPRSQSETEVELKRVGTSLPQSILRRVRDLAVIYPYPRERKSRALCVASLTSVTSCGDLVPVN